MQKREQEKMLMRWNRKWALFMDHNTLDDWFDIPYFSELNAIRIGEPYYHDASDGSLPEEEAVNWFRDKIFRFLYADNEVK